MSKFYRHGGRYCYIVEEVQGPDTVGNEKSYIETGDIGNMDRLVVKFIHVVSE